MVSQVQKNDFIAITGCGSISPLGCDRNTIYSNYRSCESLFSLKHFNHKEYAVSCLSEFSEQKMESLLFEIQKYRKLDRSVLMAIYASNLAFLEAGWFDSLNVKTAVNIGCSRGTTGAFEQLHEAYLKSKDLKTQVNTSPITTLGHVSNEVAFFLNLSGPVINTSVTCSTALQAVSNAMAWLKSGMSDRFIVGGTEAPLTNFTLAQVEALGIYTKSNHATYPCTPLIAEENRHNSFALGEGAASFALEKLNIRDINQRKPLGIIESVGYSYERPPTLTGIAEDGKLLVSSMNMALENMITDNEIDLILMHAPGTIKGDDAEMNAVIDVFRSMRPNIYSNKWKIGHTYAASAALNIELALICLQNNFNPAFPYHVNFPHNKKNIRKIMINATGFGGNATSLIISHPDLFDC